MLIAITNDFIIVRKCHTTSTISNLRTKLRSKSDISERSSASHVFLDLGVSDQNQIFWWGLLFGWFWTETLRFRVSCNSLSVQRRSESLRDYKQKNSTHFQIRKLPKQVAQIVTVSSTWQNHDFTASFECVQIFPRIQFRIYRKPVQNSHENFICWLHFLWSQTQNKEAIQLTRCNKSCP